MPTTAQLIAELGIADTIANLRTILNTLNGGGVNPALFVTLAANYTNTTATPSDIVTGSITMTGGRLLVRAVGVAAISNSDTSNTDVAARAVAQLFVDGVLQNHASGEVFASLIADGSGIPPVTLPQGNIGCIAIQAMISGLAPGAHTIAIKGSLAIVPAAGASFTCLASGGPTRNGFSLHAQEVA
jgi:hypothetical protein